MYVFNLKFAPIKERIDLLIKNVSISVYLQFKNRTNQGMDRPPNLKRFYKGCNTNMLKNKGQAWPFKKLNGVPGKLKLLIVFLV